MGRFLRFYPAEAGRTELVLIGSGIDAEALHKELAACAGPDPEAASARWEFLRYVDDPDDDPAAPER